MIRRDFHIHTDFCDGNNTAEEMVLAALDLGMTHLGFTTHSYTDFDTSYCIPKDRIGEYRAEIARLKEKYRGRITILCGVEQDLYGTESTEGYDYVIGSVHYLWKNGIWFSTDESTEALLQAKDTYYGGDGLAMAEDYFRAVEKITRLRPHIIGHFDLIAKCNRDSCLFDENDPRYLAAAYHAVDALLPLGVPFEINTGAIARGYRSVAYPAPAILSYIAKRGGKVILNSDAHSVGNLCYQFDIWEKVARDAGIAEKNMLLSPR